MKATTSGTNTRHLLNISFFAGIFEWYEFSIYLLLASTIGPLFFESGNSITEALSTFTLFAFSYFARPLGGLFFGMMGDRIGRGSALKLSLMTMAIPTALIGLLPTAAQAGLWATGLLCILRLIQGFGVGGEFPSSIAYIFDAASSHQRTLFSSITCASTSIGYLLGSIVSGLLFWYFDRQTIFDWAWRIPFLLGIPLTCIIAIIRRSIQDPKRVGRSVPRNFSDFWPRLVAARFNLIKIILLGGMLTTCGNVFLVWMPFYLEHFLGVEPKLAYFVNAIRLIVEIIVLVVAGFVVRFLDAAQALKWIHIAMLVLIYPLFQALVITATGSLFYFIALQFVFAFLLGSMNACFLEVMGELLPEDMRSLGTSVVFAVSPAFFGGIVPLVCTYLTHKTGYLAAPAFHIITLGVLVLPVILRVQSKKV